jgi:hypothetical protein
MSGADHGQDAHAASSHDGTTHAGGAQGHHDDAHGDAHAHDGETLGPIDWRAWGAMVLGVALGVVVLGALYVTINQA